VRTACAANSAGKVAGGTRLRRVVPAPQDGVALGGLQDRQVASGWPVVRNRGLQQPDQTTAQCLYRRFVEQVACVFQHAVDAARRAVGELRSTSPTDRSNFALAVAIGCGVTASPGSSSVAAAGLARLERQHHLEQRMPRQRPRRIEHLDQPLERQLLVAIGRKVAAPHPPDQLAEAWLPRGVGAQHQRVDEEPDQIVQRRIGAARDRAADRDVGAGAKPAQQSGQTRLQHHEQARAGLPRQAARPRCRSAVMLSATWPPRWLDTAGLGRSAGSSI
jgi:hypothetical protein